jgi:positive regulator of sigma E activity
MTTPPFYKSATKITLLFLMLTLCGSLVFAMFTQSEFFKDLVEIFKTVIIAVVAFYFGQKNVNAVELKE